MDKNNPKDFKIGDTVYALRVLGIPNTCEHPSCLFARRGDELVIQDIEYPSEYQRKTWFVVRPVRGGSAFHVTSGDITKMKHFSWNYSDFQKELDRNLEREYGGW